MGYEVEIEKRIGNYKHWGESKNTRDNFLKERKEKKRQKQPWGTCITEYKQKKKENGLGRVVPTKTSKIDFMKDEVVYGVKYYKGQAG